MILEKPESQQPDFIPAQTVALLEWLVATYPKTFNRDTPHPLKVGLFQDLRARHPDLDPAALRRALKKHCERRRYQLALAKEGACRVDLDGLPAGDVEEGQRRFAKSKLNAWKRAKPTKSAAQATPAPTPIPIPRPAPKPPEPPLPSPLAGRPILRLKRSATVVAVAVTRRAQP